MADKPVIAISAPVTIEAAKAEGKLPSFSTTFYTGGKLEIAGWDLPVVIDLAGLEQGNVLVANLDHEPTQRVGNFSVENDGQSLVAKGTAYPDAFPAAKEVVTAGAQGYQWQSSLEVRPSRVEEVAANKQVTVNGQELTGPMYITRAGTLKGFGFVSHGADDNTSVTIAASAASQKGTAMKPEIKAWAESMGIDIEAATPEQLAVIEKNYEGSQPLPAPKPAKAAESPFEALKIEAKRKQEIRDIADKFLARRGSNLDEIENIEKLHDHAIQAGMSPQDFRNEMYELELPAGRTPIHVSREPDRKLLPKVLEASVCRSGMLQDWEKGYSDQVLQTAQDRFPNGISLKQLWLIAAEANGYRNGGSFEVTLETQRAAFGMIGPSGYGRMQKADGFSTFSLSTTLGAIANKFLREGWMAVDQTPMRIAAIRPVNNFQQITTTSLTGDLQYLKVGSGGEIKHGTLSETTYTNQADTYARMLAISRKDIINDDLGALTAVPRRLGRGAALKLNDIFWTAFLDNSSFFTSGTNSVNTGVADMTVGGVDATEVIFNNQTDPDGKPLGVMAEILLVPTALKNKAITLNTSEWAAAGATTYATAPGSGNPFQGRFRIESSPYMSNSSYTGYDAAAWYMLANPAVMPVIEIVALNGRVEPTVETADAEFNTLGVQMRGYADIGCSKQEYRGGVRADGGSS